MHIIAFIGKSGTGKSYKSILVGQEFEVDYIIDDGILIRRNKLLSGKSAKSESSRLKAVKRALFMEENHRAEVRSILMEGKPERIMIIGTSDNMVEKIARALELGEIDERIYIDEVSTEEEMELARKQRREEGKHIIPLPTLEIKKDFSGYFMDDLRVVKMKSYGQEVYEKTIMRPSFSYLGGYTISDKVIRDVAKHIAISSEAVDRSYRVHIDHHREGIVISLDIFTIEGYDIAGAVEDIQSEILETVESMTSLNVLKVDINIVRQISPNKNAHKRINI